MKVFISWSGNLSRRMAETLREWLPNVLQAVEPWMSAEDIEKGARWSTDIATELAKTRAGILCVTPDNLEAPWLNFEAGALSKTLERTFVSPYLMGLRPSDIKGPLVQFQATESTKTDTRRLVGTLNKALDDAALPEKQVDKTFEIWWPELESGLQKIQSEKVPQRQQRAEREILEEILALVRDQAKRTPFESGYIPGFQQREPLMVLGRTAISSSGITGWRPSPAIVYVDPSTGKIVAPNLQTVETVEASEEKKTPTEDVKAEATKKKPDA